MEIGDGQQLGLSVSEPLRTSQTLALGAMPVAAAIVGDAHVPAVVALLDMAAERRGAARLNGGHDPTLRLGDGDALPSRAA
jgi:hypothetical protein